MIILLFQFLIFLIFILWLIIWGFFKLFANVRKKGIDLGRSRTYEAQLKDPKYIAKKEEPRKRKSYKPKKIEK